MPRPVQHHPARHPSFVATSVSEWTDDRLLMLAATRFHP
jgi:hypothetical protein